VRSIAPVQTRIQESFFPCVLLPGLANTKKSKNRSKFLTENLFQQNLEIDEETFLRDFEEMEKERNSYQLPAAVTDFSLNYSDEVETS